MLLYVNGDMPERHTEEQCVSYLAVVSMRTSLLPLLPCYMRLPDVTVSLDGLAPHVPFLHISVSCYSQDDVKLVFSAMSHYFAHAYACPPLCICTLCCLSPFRHYLLRPYSKIFVGGLSWDVTDGTLSLLILPPTPFAMSCPFPNSLKCVGCDDTFLPYFSPFFS